MKQILIDGFLILPCVTQGDFDRLPFDGWYGGDRWDKETEEWVPQEYLPRPQIVWPIGNTRPFWVILGDDNRIISQEALQNPLPGIPHVKRDAWNAEWQFCVPDDPTKLLSFVYPTEENQ